MIFTDKLATDNSIFKPIAMKPVSNQDDKKDEPLK